MTSGTSQTAPVQTQIAPAQDAPAVLEVDDLTIGYPGVDGTPVVLVDHISFTLRENEVLCLVGESGSGKSVTMLAVLGLLPSPLEVLSGSVRFRGTDLLTLPERELRALRGKDLAMVFQDPMTALNPVRRVGRQIARAIAVHNPGLSRRQRAERVVELLEGVGVPQASERARAYPHQWSGGMRQRAVIATAMANNPALLVADEPTTALDVSVQAQVMDVLASARAAGGAAMVLITHDLGLVAQVADRVAIMYSGRIVEEASVWDTFATPAHPYTRGLLASLLSAEAVGGRAHAIPGQPPSPTARPQGCTFAPRCELALKSATCLEVVPALQTARPGRSEQVAACHHTRALDPTGTPAPAPAGGRP